MLPMSFGPKLVGLKSSIGMIKLLFIIPTVNRNMYMYICMFTNPSHDKLKIHDLQNHLHGGFANIKRLLHDIFHIGPCISPAAKLED
jgi:hypothetical protein